jgi:hypothetical protein
MLYKESDAANSTTVPFPITGPCQGASSCALDDFTQLLSSMSYTSLEEWCVLCENDSADVCLQVKLNALSPQSTSVSVTPTASPVTSCSSVSVGSLIGTLCGGIVLGLLLFVMFNKFMRTKSPNDGVDVEAIDPDKIISFASSDKIN